MMIKILFSGLLLFLTTSCKPILNWWHQKNPILIGEYGSMTGSESSFGQNAHKGILLAIEEFNQSGGIDNRKIELITKDDESSLNKTRQVVKELILEHQVLAILGEVSSNRSLAAAPIAQKHQIPMITPASTNPQITPVGNYIFRACYIDPFQGFVMAKFAKKELKLKKVAILQDKSSNYSRDLARFFENTFTDLNGEIVAIEHYESGKTDYKKNLLNIKKHNPEALFIPGYYSEVGLIARQARQLGIDAILLGGDGWDSKRLFEIGGEAINGGYFSNHYTAENDNPRSKSFVKAFQKKYGHIPDGVAAMGYDATKILISAIKKSHKDLTSKNIRKHLAETKNYDGVTGSISFDKNRNAIKPAVVLKVDGTDNRYVTTVHPE